MYWRYSLFELPLLVSGIVLLALAGIIWQRRSATGAGVFTLMLLALALWSLGNMLEIGCTQLPAKLFWANVQYLGIVSVPVLWFVFGVQYSSWGHRPTRRQLALLAIIPVVTLLLVWTDPWHGLMRRNVRLDANGPFSIIAKTFGPWFWVHTAYSYLALLAGSSALILSLLRSPRLYRGQVISLLVGAFLPWVGNAVYLLGYRAAPRIDPTPVMFTLSSIAAAWSLLRYGFLDIVPAARDTVIESMSDGLVVLDARNRVVDLNPAAQRIIGRASLQVIGKPVAEVLNARPEMMEGNCHEGGVRGELVMGQGQGKCCYDLQVSPVCDRQGRVAGRVIALRDISEQKRTAEERERLIQQLQAALSQVRKLTGLLPMCAACKKIRNDTGYWEAVETYISEHSDAVFTHGICPDCMRKLYPEFVGPEQD